MLEIFSLAVEAVLFGRDATVTPSKEVFRVNILLHDRGAIDQ